MGLFSRRRKLPADRRPPLDREERVLTWAQITDTDGVAVVTNYGLWLPGKSARLGWHDIHKAAWSGQELTITPAESVTHRDNYAVLSDCPPEKYALTDPGEVPEQVRSRVTRSVAYTSHHPVPGGGVRVVARRVAGVNGLTWTVRYDPGTPTDDAAVIEETDRLVAAAQSSTDPGL